MEITLDGLQEILGHRFSDRGLLRTALTHSSWVNEHHCAEEHNERLEFLGDAVLELTISSELFTRFPTAREGDMTRLRSSLVNTHVLATLARSVLLDKILRLGRGEENQGGRNRDALLADTLEAVLGAVYLDGGFSGARDVIARLYEGRWPERADRTRRKDFKTRLQEATQRTSQGLPTYVLESSTGPEHARTFLVRVDLPDGRRFFATGGSVKRAEQEAARCALAAFDVEAPASLTPEADLAPEADLPTAAPDAGR